MIRSFLTAAALLAFAHFIAGQAAIAIYRAETAQLEYWERVR